MEVIKEYVVKIKWQHDLQSKKKVLSEMRKSFQGLTRDIEKTTRAAKEFSKLDIPHVTRRGKSGKAILFPHLQTAKGRSHFDDYTKSVGRAFSKSFETIKNVRTGRFGLGGMAGEAAEGGLAELLGIGAPLVVAITGLTKAFSTYSGHIAKQSINSQITGLGPQGPAVTALKKAGIDISPLTRWTTLSRQYQAGDVGAMQQALQLGGQVFASDPTNPAVQKVGRLIMQGHATGSRVIASLISSSKKETKDQFFDALTKLGVDAKSASLWSDDRRDVNRFLTMPANQIPPNMKNLVANLRKELAGASFGLAADKAGQTALGGAPAAVSRSEAEFYNLGAAAFKNINEYLGKKLKHPEQIHHASPMQQAFDPYQTGPQLRLPKTGSGQTNKLISSGSNSSGVTFDNFSNNVFSEY